MMVAKKKSPLKVTKVARTKLRNQKAFLKVYCECGNITVAAREAGVARSRHGYWLQEPAYAKQFEEAKAEALDLLEHEARRRAVDGVEQPVFQGGMKVGTIIRYSDTLLIFMLKGLAPDKYKDRYHGVLTGPGGGPIQHEHNIMKSDSDIGGNLAEYFSAYLQGKEDSKSSPGQDAARPKTRIPGKPKKAVN